MQLCREIGMLLGLTVISISLLAADTSPSENEAVPMSYLNGYTMGKALANHYENGDKERFIRGLVDGITNTNTISMTEGATRDAKQAWFKEPGLSMKEKASYAYGYLMGEANRQQDASLLPHVLTQGLLDSLQNSGAPYVAKDQGSAIVTKYQRKQYYQRKRAVADSIKKHERAGKAFLASNAKESGIIQTKSGLQYKIISAGQGESPTAEDTVKVTMVAKKIDGQVFYDSRIDEQGEPIAIKVKKTIEGWQEALVKMSPGAEWEIFVPAKLAYGNAGWRGRVEPGETLIYRLKMIEVIPADQVEEQG